MRRMVRTARTDASRSLGELLESMNESLDADDRALLAEPLAIERPPVRARELLLPDDDDAPTRRAS